jgi:hypothetical protein
VCRISEDQHVLLIVPSHGRIIAKLLSEAVVDFITIQCE